MHIEISTTTIDKCEALYTSHYEGKLIVTNYVFEYDDRVTYVIIDRGSDSVTIRSAIGNQVPLFWSWIDGRLNISDEMLVLLDRNGIDLPADPDEIDNIGLMEAMLFDFPLVDRTYFKKIKKTQMGQEIIFSLRTERNTVQWHWLPSIQNARTDEPNLLSHATDLLQNIAKDFSETSRILIPLTAGYDSRLIASQLVKQKHSEIASYTFQRGPSFETFCAKKVARKLGISHNTLNLDSICYNQFSDSLAVRTGGLVSPMHSHGLYCCSNLLPNTLRNYTRIFGYFGDPITGAMTEPFDLAKIRSTPEGIFESYKRTLFTDVLAPIKEAIISDIDQIYELYKISSSKANTFHEFWKIHERQNGLITHLFHTHRTWLNADVELPYINRGFCDFFLSLPYKYRYNRKLFKKIHEILNPETFNIASNHFSTHSKWGRAEIFCDLAQRSVNKLFPTNNLMINPFNYENHNNNLKHDLWKKITIGAEVFSQTNGVNIHKIQRNEFYNSTVKELYRLSSLNSLIKI